MNETTIESMTPEPWYKQFYPWMLIAIPFLTVVGCMITITLAITSENALVKENYYKEGLSINKNMQRLTQAATLNLEGLLRGDKHQLSLALQGDVADWPETLEINFSHATLEALDRTVAMEKTAPGQYTSAWEQLPDGAWYYQLMPDDQAWELTDRFQVDDVFQVRLSGNKT